MPDYVIGDLGDGSGLAIAAKEIAGSPNVYHQRIVSQYMVGTTPTDVTATTAMPITPGTGAVFVLGAGAALVGKVGIDQTTPGATNAVAPIAGQAGVAGGAGAVGATVQRMTLASDDPAVVDLAAMVVDLAAIEVLLGTIDADTAAIATDTAAMVVDLAAIEVLLGTIDNDTGCMVAWDSGEDECRSIPVADYVMYGTVRHQVKRFGVLATADATTIVAAPTGTKKPLIRSLALISISTTGTTFYLQTATTNTALLGSSGNPIPVGQDADGNMAPGVVLGKNDDGWIQSPDADEAIQVKMPGGAQPIQFVGTYIEVS